MQGIPKAILVPLRRLLIDCEQFASDIDIRAVFSEEKLAIFRSGLKSASSASGRVDLNIPYLWGCSLKTGENALILFLRWMAVLYESQDKQEQFIRLADQLEHIKQTDPTFPTFKPEANPDHEPMLQMLEIEQMYQTARSVAHIDVPRYFDGQQRNDYSGTAWLIAPSLAITCAHVLRARNQYETLEDADFNDQVASTLLTFDYLSSGRGTQYKIHKIEHNNDDLDYAIIRLDDRSQVPSRQWGCLYLEKSDAPITTQTSLFIVQHPLGGQQQGAVGKFVHIDSQAGIIYYRSTA